MKSTILHASPPRWAAFGLALLLVPAAFAARRNKASDAAPKTDKSAPVAPPSAKGLVTLFSGSASELDQNWLDLGSGGRPQWKLEEGSKAMVANGGDLVTKQKFTDFQLHLEFRVPYMPEAHGQERGNSGVYLQGRYEIQVLDSYGIADPGTGDCGAVYGQSAPLVNANKSPLQWQTYDITFRGARADASGKITEPARVTILLNGIPVQNNTVIPGVTGGPMDDKVGEPGPLRLQFHGYPVAYRNVWVLPLPLHGATHY